MGGIFSSPEPPEPPPPPPDNSKEEERLRRERLRRQRQGLRSTVRTSERGVLATADGPPQRKRLLGE